MKIRRTPTLFFALSTLALAALGCGPEIPAGLGSSSPSQPSSQSKPTEPTDSGSAASSSEDSGSPASGSTGGSGADVNSTAVLASVSNNIYLTSPVFTEVTRAPYASQAAVGSMIREWVNTSSLSVYAAISPSVTGSGVIAPVGTTIVRAVLAEDGGVGELTLMYKGPAGYNPALGDWWFGVAAPDGTAAETDAGPEVGKLTGCFGCHVPRANDGYLFGVPLDDRASDDGGAGSGSTAPVADGGMEDAATDAGDDDAGADSGHHRGGHGGF